MTLIFLCDFFLLYSFFHLNFQFGKCFWVQNPFLTNFKVFLYKCHCDSWDMSKKVTGIYLLKLVKIGPVTAKILGIWTNVANTNIAWKNVSDSWELFKNVSGTYLSNLVKIRPLTAEILPIWTNVASSNVAWTNVTMTVDI